MDEYHITKIENGLIKIIPYSKLEKEILQTKLSGLHHDLNLIKDKIAELEENYFGEAPKCVPMSLSDAIREEIKRTETFKASDIANKLKPEYEGAYAKTSIYSTAHNIIKELVNQEVLIKKLDGTYLNKQYEAPEESEDALNESVDDASMPNGEQQ